MPSSATFSREVRIDVGPPPAKHSGFDPRNLEVIPAWLLSYAAVDVWSQAVKESLPERIVLAVDPIWPDRPTWLIVQVIGATSLAVRLLSCRAPRVQSAAPPSSERLQS